MPAKPVYKKSTCSRESVHHSKGLRKSRKPKSAFTLQHNNKYREMPRSEEEKTKVNGGAVTEEKYPWHLLRKTILLLNSFMGSCRCRYTGILFFLMMFSLSIWFNCWGNWTHSAGLEGPTRSQYWRNILHHNDELHRISGGLLLYWILAGQAASLQISDPGR